MSFKLIAIRPVIGISQKYLKNLMAGEVYNFCNEYSLLNTKGRPISFKETAHSVRYEQQIPHDLYSVKKGSRELININISAIVGKNGTGKSSLIDLLLHAIFIISESLRLVKPGNFISQQDEKLDENERRRYELEISEMRRGVKVEVYYILDQRYYKIIIKNGLYRLESYCSFEKEDLYFKDYPLVNDYQDVNHLFYSIVVNYSLYAYNSNFNGVWLKSFFHKNDGYQMPIVINPFRNEGVIDINSEIFLTRSRLLSNILSISGYKKINAKSAISKIELFFDKHKDYRTLPNGKPRFSQDFILKFRHLILAPLFLKMFGTSNPYPKINTPLKKYGEIYLINKLITIPAKYAAFEEFDNRILLARDKTDNYRLKPNNAKEYVKELYEDRSHVTLKARQVLNFLKEDIYSLPNDVDLKRRIELRSVVKKINRLKLNDWFTELIDYLPPPFLFSRISFIDGSYFDDLSSGEKQKIFSLNSVVYHLRNLDSVNKNKFRNAQKKLYSYQCINLVFDEVELYYHPQYQKETISSLLDLIKLSNLQFIKNINILFLTHSPFILSDIPIQNITLLTINEKTGRSKLIGGGDKEQSFGANIHDLFSNSFFLTGSLIGDFADQKILNLIAKAKKGRLSNDDKILLELIGDSFLKSNIKSLSKSDDQN